MGEKLLRSASAAALKQRKAIDADCNVVLLLFRKRQCKAVKERLDCTGNPRGNPGVRQGRPGKEAAAGGSPTRPSNNARQLFLSL